MPELPRYQQQQTASNQLQVVRQARDDTPDIGAGVRQVGSAIDGFTQKLETARAKSEIVRAESTLRKEYDALYRELEQDGDGDYDKFEERFAKKAQAITARTMKGLKTGRAQSIMTERAVGLQDDYTIRVRGLQRQRGVAEVKATGSAMIEEYRDAAADTTIPSEELARRRTTAEAYMRDMKSNGWINDVEMEAFVQDADDIAMAGFTNRIGDQVEALIDAGQYAEADRLFKSSYPDMDPTKRDAMEKALEAKAVEKRAIDIVDDYNNRGLTPAEMREEIRGIDDPTLRKAVEARRDYENAETDALTAEMQDNLFEDWGFPIIMGERKVEDIPRNVLEAMSVAQVQQLKRAEVARLKGEMRVTDPEKMMHFHDLLADGMAREARQFLRENVMSFDEEDLEEFYSKSAKPSKDVIKSIVTERDVVNGVIDSAKIKSGDEIEFKAEINSWYRAQQAGGKPPPTEAELQEKAEELATKYKFRRQGDWFHEERYAFKGSDIIPAGVMQDIAAIYGKGGKINIDQAEADYVEAARDLEAVDLPVTPANIIAIMRKEAEAGD